MTATLMGSVLVLGFLIRFYLRSRFMYTPRHDQPGRSLGAGAWVQGFYDF